MIVYNVGERFKCNIKHYLAPLCRAQTPGPQVSFFLAAQETRVLKQIPFVTVRPKFMTISRRPPNKSARAKIPGF